ncbi:MAG: acetate--CoA ligase family protein [Streptosporangiaceae bacterium]
MPDGTYAGSDALGSTGAVPTGFRDRSRQVRTWLAEHLPATGRLGEAELRELLGELIDFGPATSCSDVSGAVRAAEALGFPVVLKLLEPGVLHKTELGLVEVGLVSGDEVARAADRLLRQRDQGAGQPLFSVQAQLSGTEMAIGVRRDGLGAVCMVGAGGTLIEVRRDVAFLMAPVTEPEAAKALGGLNIAEVLNGYRGRDRADVQSLARLVARVSELALAIPEIVELDLNPVIVTPSGCAVADASAIVQPATSDPDGTDFADLEPMLSPRRIAVIGASTDTTKAGGSVVRYLRKHGYGGEVVAVNPGGRSVDGALAVSSLSQIAEPVDLACVAVPAAATIAAVQECAAQRVPAAIVYSAGYAETGPDGRAAQQRLLEAAGGKVRLLGPNSMGIAVPAARVFATFGTALEVDDFVSGPVAFISQSGALANSLFSRSREYGIGFSHWISVGNEADLGVEDFLAYLADDDSCRVICMFLETIRRPAAFAEGARRARAADKPLIVLKAGRTEAGSASAASHTGALSGSDVSYTAFFGKHGIIRVADLEDLFISSQGVLMGGPSAGPRMGIVSMSGGACSIVADACVSSGLEVPVLDEQTQSLLRQIVPSFGTVSNPVDVTATGIWQPSLVREVVSVLLDCEAVDAVLVQLSTNADPGAQAMATDLTALWRTAAKPLLVGRIGASALAPQAMQIYATAGMHIFAWPEQLVRAAVTTVEFGRQSG